MRPTTTGGREMIGVQIAPWSPMRQLVAASSVFSKAFDVIWVPDQMPARNMHVALAAIAAQGEVGVGSCVSVPLSRNPIDLASAMASIAELAAERPVLMGMGAGGPLVASLMPKKSVIEVLHESIGFIRRLWAGELVPLADYPVLTARLGWRPEATAKLTYPVPAPIPILLAVGGPRTLDLASRAADGLICTSTYPALSYAALRSGKHAAARQIMDLAAQRERAGWPMRLIYGLNCCMSRDRAAARSFARRQAVLVAGNRAVWPTLEAIDLDLDSAKAVRSALDRGEGIEAAARLVSDDMLDAFVLAGTPDECSSQVAELRELARSVGFTEFYFGVPLGPDLAEAAQILVDVVVPELWPGRS